MKRIKLIFTKDNDADDELVKDQREGFIRYKDEYQQWDFNKVDTTARSNKLTMDRIEALDISEETKQLLIDKALGKSIGFELKSRPFIPKKVVKMMTQVIYEEMYNNGIGPKKGTEHRFSEEILKYYKREFPILKTGITKLFMALGNGLSFRFMVTGQEEALAKVIKKRRIQLTSNGRSF